MFYKLFTEFEDSVHQLDVLIAYTQSSSSSRVQTGGIAFQQHVESLREIKRLYEEADKLDDEADFFDDLATWAALDQEEEDPNIESLREQARDLRGRAEDLVNFTLLPCKHFFLYYEPFIRINKQ